MEITTAILCDFAQVRERLLFVISGCVTRVWRDKLPATLSMDLALVIELDQIEMTRPHEIEVYIMGEDGARVAQTKAGFQVQGQGLAPAETVQMPLVVNLRNVRVEQFGSYDAKVYFDGQHRRTLSFQVVERSQGNTIVPS